MQITIPSNPVTKKNHSKIVMKKYPNGKSFPIIIPSPAYKKYEAFAKEFMPKVETIDYPINLEAHYYMGTRRLCDITNLLQATCDILVKYKILSDDNYSIIASTDGTRVEYDKENPRVEIFITKK